MDYLVRSPGARLASHVEYFWMIRDAPAHALERIVPCGTLELVVNLREDEIRIYDHAGRLVSRLDGAVVSGVYRRYFVVDTREHATTIGVHFRPGGARAVLGVPPGELVDRHVELSALWPAYARELRERLCEAREPAAAFAILEGALTARLAQRAAHPAILHALAMLPAASIGEIASSLELSRRRLIEVFTAEVGATPKRMSRLLRFQQALALASRGSGWSRAAHVSGYYDQAHLIRDCNEFAGVPPVELLRARAGVKEHHAAITGGSNSSKTRAPRERTVTACAPSSSSR